MSQFINSRDALVNEGIDGLLRTGRGKLARLDGYPHVKVVLRSDLDAGRVALVSGGGSGHEPAHAGFVGRGMLSAAVCGDVFASPSADAVLAGILAVTGTAGCLLIVKNYTGDRLNFGLAAERARALGKRVEMVVVDDDVALPDLPQPRGVAGTLFVHKIAGAMAEQGAPLEEVADTARRVIADVASIGMSLGSCTVPGVGRADRIPPGKAELGLGIHGEPGVEQVDFDGARATISMMVDRLAPTMANGPHVALLNNLGGAMPLEMAVLAEELCRSDIGGRISHMIGPAPLMTSLDMHGFSLSLLPVDAARIEALGATVDPVAWPGLTKISEPAVVAMPSGLEPPRFEASANPQQRGLIAAACAALVAAEPALNALDAKSGDGDTGTTVATAARAVEAVLDRLPLADEAQTFRALSAELSQTMGGSSGVLLAIFFAAAADAAEGGADGVAPLRAGLDRIRQVGGAGPGDRTLIDALHPALEALPSSLAEAARAAREGADRTAGITRAKAGRAAYVPAASLKGHNDPGAEAVAVLFEHLARR